MPQDDSKKKAIRWASLSDIFKSEEYIAAFRKQMDEELTRMFRLPADMFEERRGWIHESRRVVVPRAANPPHRNAYEEYLANNAMPVEAVFGRLCEEPPDTPSPLTLDDYAMLLLRQLDELQTQIDLKPRNTDITVKEWQPMAQHERALTDEKNRLKRDLVDCLIHLAQYPDLESPRTAEGNMILPQRLYDQAFAFNAWREERLTWGESSWANDVIKAYQKWRDK